MADDTTVVSFRLPHSIAERLSEAAGRASTSRAEFTANFIVNAISDESIYSFQGPPHWILATAKAISIVDEAESVITSLKFQFGDFDKELQQAIAIPGSTLSLMLLCQKIDHMHETMQALVRHIEQIHEQGAK